MHLSFDSWVAFFRQYEHENVQICPFLNRLILTFQNSKFEGNNDPFLYIYNIRKKMNNELLRYYLPTPPLEQDMTQGQFLSGV